MVTVRKVFAGVAVAGLVATLGTACNKGGNAKKGGKTVATVDDEDISTGELQDELDKLPPYLKGRVSTPEGRKEFLDNLLTRRALMHEAKTTGIESDPQIQKQINEYKERLILQKLMQENIEKEPQVSDDEIKKYFDSHPEEFKESEQVRARHILIKTDGNATPQQKAEAKAKAEKLLARAKKGEDFEKLAKENSQDPGSASRGGDLGFFPKGRMAPAFEASAFAMKKPGQLSGVVETQFGFHVIQYVDRQVTKEKGFDEAKEVIRRRLAPQKQRESYQAFIENVKKKHKIEVKDDVLNTMTAPAGDAPAAPAPGQPGMNPHMQGNPHQGQ
jgi:peptidyl-prolyl cis-trans isomerase C